MGLWFRNFAVVAAVAAAGLALAASAAPTLPKLADTRASAIPVDVELVIAVDVSYSMDPDEQSLQREGYVLALTSKEFLQALRQGAHGKIAITYFEWAGQSDQKILMPWRVIDGPESADAVADRARDEPADHAALSGLDVDDVGEVIPRFHDPVARFEAFLAAMQADRAGRVAATQAECESALGYRDVLDHWRGLLDAGLPWRVTHNDCKLDNLLFDADDRAKCVIDLDTVMPGSLLFDFGDMARTMVSPVPEDSTDLARVGVRHDYFAALAGGYIKGCGVLLAPLERDNLVFAARLVTGVMALRFLTDWLDGDRYYRVDRPAHNLERARNQFALFAALTAQVESLQALVPSG